MELSTRSCIFLSVITITLVLTVLYFKGAFDKHTGIEGMSDMAVCKHGITIDHKGGCKYCHQPNAVCEHGLSHGCTECHSNPRSNYEVLDYSGEQLSPLQILNENDEGVPTYDTYDANHI
jgi:hypothetical protein